MADLLFRRPRKEQDGSNVVLVFGAGNAPAATGASTPMSLDVALPAMRLDLRFGYATPAALDLALPAMRLDLQLKWDANTWRPEAARTLALQQEAVAARSTATSRQQDAARMLVTAAQRQQQAAPASRASAMCWQGAAQAQARAVARWQDGAPQTRLAQVLWQSAEQLSRSAAARWQDGAPVSRGSALRWQSALPLFGKAVARWQEADGLRASSARQPLRHGLPMARGTRARWQEAMQPWPGKTVLAVVLPDTRCYTPPPGDAVLLVFSQIRRGDGVLLFRCHGRRAPNTLPLLVVPKLESYMHLSEIKASIWPSGEPVVLESCSISTDVGGYAWQLDASGPVHLMQQLAPASNGQRQQLKIEVNGLAWIFVVGLRRRNRQWMQQSVSITGRSATSLLDAPFQPVKTWASAAQITAQQIVLAALNGTGTTLDWRLDDWLVPGGIWSHQGSPLSVATRVADAVGAVVQSDRAANTLRILPRYKAMPWQWATTAPDVQLPISYVLVDGLEERDETTYNAIYTSGTSAGRLRRTVRSGTPGNLLAPMVTDALLTESAAHVQRARAELGKGGWQADVSINCPLNTSAGHPGLLDVGTLLELVDTDSTWRGLVRGISISAGNGSPEVRQTAKVERHFAEVHA